MGCCGKLMLAIITLVVGLLKIGCAIAIICITAMHLQDFNLVTNLPGADNITNPTNLDLGAFEASCTLGAFDEDWGTAGNLCYYVYAVAGVSLVVEVLLFILLCCTCNCCGMGFVLEFAFAAFGTLWWAAAGVVLTINVEGAKDSLLSPFGDIAGALGAPPPPGINPNDLYPELNDWRLAVVILAWGACGMFGLLTLIYIGKLLAKCCSCCLCCGDDGGKVSP